MSGAHRGNARTDPWIRRGLLTDEFVRPARSQRRVVAVLGWGIAVIAIVVGGLLLGTVLFIAPKDPGGHVSVPLFATTSLLPTT